MAAISLVQYIDPTLKLNAPKALVIPRGSPNITYNRTTAPVSSTSFNVQRNLPSPQTLLHPYVEVILDFDFCLYLCVFL